MTKEIRQDRVLAVLVAALSVVLLLRFGCDPKIPAAQSKLTADTVFAQLATVAQQAVTINEREYKNRKKADSIRVSVDVLVDNNNLLLDSIKMLTRALNTLQQGEIQSQKVITDTEPVQELLSRAEAHIDDDDSIAKSDSMKMIVENTELTGDFNTQLRLAYKSTDSLTRRAQHLERTVKRQKFIMGGAAAVIVVVILKAVIH